MEWDGIGDGEVGYQGGRRQRKRVREGISRTEIKTRPMQSSFRLIEGRKHGVESSTVQYSTAQPGTEQYRTVYGTVQYSIRHNTVQYNSVQHRAHCSFLPGVCTILSDDPMLADKSSTNFWRPRRRGWRERAKRARRGEIGEEMREVKRVEIRE
jgi:hypothetical protein